MLVVVCCTAVGVKYMKCMLVGSGHDVSVVCWLWSPYVIGQTIIFSCCFFFLLLSSFFFFSLA